MMNTSRIPFLVEIDEFGLQEAHGFFYVDGHNLIIEYQKEDGILGVVKSNIKEIKIPFSNIAGISFFKKLFSARVEIQGKRMIDLEHVELAKRGVINLKVKRKHKSVAEYFVSHLRVELSEHKLHELEEEDRKLQMGE